MTFVLSVLIVVLPAVVVALITGWWWQTALSAAIAWPAALALAWVLVWIGRRAVALINR